MAAKTTPIPKGYHTVTPVLTVHGAANLIEFLKRAFGAQETYRLPGPEGTVQHAELKIGDSMVMVGEATDQWKPMPATIALYVEDADAWYARALQAGGTSLREPSDQFYGDRSAGVKDSVGNHW
jgi:PhnB protein